MMLKRLNAEFNALGLQGSMRSFTVSRLRHGKFLRARLSLNVALLSTVSLLAASSVTSAMAQDATAAPESVVVSASRISTAGFEAPTPVTVVGQADLQNTATTKVADVLAQLPQFGIGTATVSNWNGQAGGGGASTVNLRNLGVTRTLVLLDGERVVSSSLTNAVDLNTLPNSLVKRVDVVTGGASATWGSDAVAGVVNLVLDKNYEGLKASAQYGNDGQLNYETYKGDVAYGTSFADGRGHFLASASYLRSPQIVLQKDMNWFSGGNLVNNPAYAAGNGQPQLMAVRNVGLSQSTQGGVITSGPLKNTQFVGNGTPTIYNPGNVSSTFSYGGDGDVTTLSRDEVAGAESAYNLFTYGSYQLTNSITAHLSLNYGFDSGLSSSSPAIANSITIKNDNAYLPQSVKTAMANAGVTSFVLGSSMGNLGNPRGGSYATNYTGDRVMQRAELGFDGVFWNDWTWKAYYSHSETRFAERFYNNPLKPNLALAEDAVLNPATGAIVCRSTLTNPSNGCAPLDLFGVNVASPQALAYINPVAYTQVTNRQDAAEASFSGTPLEDWAGPISLAGGVAYRSESADSVSDANSLAGNYTFGNNGPFHGAVNVWEGFIETNVPLARNLPFAEALDLDLAGRITDYSTSGVVETWKMGLSDQVTDEIRLRATWSADIRAPNLAELFTQSTSGNRSILDPFTGKANITAAVAKGNPNLSPENANTVSGGIVYQPKWLEGLSLSADWYSISIKSAIASVSAENEIAFCFAGNQFYCPLLIRNGSGVLTQVISVPANTSVATSSGLDFESQYTHELWDGNVTLRAVGNYTDENVSSQAGVLVDNAGSLGPDTVGGQGLPKFRTNLSATYSTDEYSATVQTRIFGSARIVNTWGPSMLSVSDNAVPAVAYLDLRASYNLPFEQSVQLFAAVDNALNIPPPNIPHTASAPSANTAAPVANFYDLLGRRFNFGIRANF